MPANVESMFSVRQMPWHREGDILDDYPGTWAEARVLAGLDWDPVPADIYLAQQLSCYPPDYLAQEPSVDRVLEIIEKFEEDITDKARRHGQLKVVLEVGEPISVSPERSRGAPVDPLMAEIQSSLQAMIDRLTAESPLLDATAADPVSGP